MKAAAFAYLIVHTISYGGLTQSLIVFVYPNMTTCEIARVSLKIEKTRDDTTVESIKCVKDRPKWWKPAEVERKS